MRHMERSVSTLKINSIKNETRTKNDIKKKTKENTQLIQELNSIKFDEKNLRYKIDLQKKEIRDLKNKLAEAGVSVKMKGSALIPDTTK